MPDQNLSIDLPVTPCPKPRMTQRDKWAKRPAVLRYRAFCDDLRAAWGNRAYPLSDARVTFYVPMPKSWSAKKRAEMVGQPHQQKPDLDNLVKAFNDALLPEDCAVWDQRGTKRWAVEGAITVDIEF